MAKFTWTCPRKDLTLVDDDYDAIRRASGLHYSEKHSPNNPNVPKEEWLDSAVYRHNSIISPVESDSAKRKEIALASRDLQKRILA
jgi:hypothetical protein